MVRYLHIWRDTRGRNFWHRALLRLHQREFKNLERLFIIKREVFGAGSFKR